MAFGSLLFIALSLASDAFAASLSCGMANYKTPVKYAFLTGVSFGFFQAFMPVLATLVTTSLHEIISSLATIITPTILAIIGISMLFESFKDDKKNYDMRNIKIVISLSIATSIDAFAAGIPMCMMYDSMVLPILFIGTLTYILSFFGVLIGYTFHSCHIFKDKIEVVGGLLLIITASVHFITNR